jgi:predicted NBD/HSP70 family sugar kinase
MRTLKLTGTINSALQNRINRSVIFHYLRENGPSYRARISKDLQISAPAVSRVIEKLIEERYVIETDKIVTSTGKRPTQLRINAERGIVIGVDLIKERVELAITDFSGKVLSTYHGFKFTEEIHVLESLINDIRKVLDCHKRVESQSHCCLEAIGIGIPAVVDQISGEVLDAPLYNNLIGLNLKKELERVFHIPVYVENVVRLSTLGEKNYGEGRNVNNFVYVEISNGIGAGIIIENYLVRGTNGAAGEIGFSIVGRENLGYKVKTKGYLENNASVDTLRTLALREIKNKKATMISTLVNNDLKKLDPSVVCIAATRGDKVALEIVAEVVDIISIEIIQLTLILNPQLIVIGGDFCNLPSVNELFVEPIIKNIRRSIPFISPVDIKLSALGEDAGVIGASFFAIESLLTGEFPYAIDYKIFSPTNSVANSHIAVK